MSRYDAGRDVYVAVDRIPLATINECLATFIRSRGRYTQLGDDLLRQAQTTPALVSLSRDIRQSLWRDAVERPDQEVSETITRLWRPLAPDDLTEDNQISAMTVLPRKYLVFPADPTRMSAVHRSFYAALESALLTTRKEAFLRLRNKVTTKNNAKPDDVFQLEAVPNLRDFGQTIDKSEALIATYREVQDDAINSDQMVPAMPADKEGSGSLTTFDSPRDVLIHVDAFPVPVWDELIRAYFDAHTTDRSASSSLVGAMRPTEDLAWASLYHDIRKSLVRRSSSAFDQEKGAALSQGEDRGDVNYLCFSSNRLRMDATYARIVGALSRVFGTIHHKAVTEAEADANVDRPSGGTSVHSCGINRALGAIKAAAVTSRSLRSLYQAKVAELTRAERSKSYIMVE